MSTNYHCECCAFKTLSSKRYENHLKSKTHKIKSDKKEKKEVQEKSIETRIQELTNRLLKREKNMKYKCEFCKRGFTSKYGLKQHHKVCFDNPDSKNYIAPVSMYKSDSDDDLDYLNMDNDELGEDSMDCDYNVSNNNIETKDVPFFSENNIANMFNNMKDMSFNSSTNTVTTNTRITIDGVEICDNPMDDYETKNTLIHSFCHPFFKSNSHLVPPAFFDDDDFSTIFNHVHGLQITTESQIMSQEQYKNKKLQELKNTNIQKTITDGLHNMS